jgi:hypothetical protein
MYYECEWVCDTCGEPISPQSSSRAVCYGSTTKKPGLAMNFNFHEFDGRRCFTAFVLYSAYLKTFKASGLYGKLELRQLKTFLPEANARFPERKNSCSTNRCEPTTQASDTDEQSMRADFQIGKHTAPN